MRKGCAALGVVCGEGERRGDQKGRGPQKRAASEEDQSNCVVLEARGKRQSEGRRTAYAFAPSMAFLRGASASASKPEGRKRGDGAQLKKDKD